MHILLSSVPPDKYCNTLLNYATAMSFCIVFS